MDILPANVTATVLLHLSLPEKFYFRCVCKSWDRLITTSRLRTLNLLGSVAYLPDQRRKLRTCLRVFGSTIERLILPLPLDDVDGDRLVSEAASLRYLVAPGFQASVTAVRLPRLRRLRLFSVGRVVLFKKQGRRQVTDPSVDALMELIAVAGVKLDIVYPMYTPVAAHRLVHCPQPEAIAGISLTEVYNSPRSAGMSNVLDLLASNCNAVTRLTLSCSRFSLSLDAACYRNVKVLKITLRDRVSGSVAPLDYLMDLIGPQLDHLSVCGRCEFGFVRKLVNARSISLTGAPLTDASDLAPCGRLEKLHVQPLAMEQFLSCLSADHPALKELRIPAAESSSDTRSVQRATDGDLTSKLLERLLRGLADLQALDISGHRYHGIEAGDEDLLSPILRVGTGLQFLALHCRYGTRKSLLNFLSERAKLIRDEGAELPLLWIYYQGGSGGGIRKSKKDGWSLWRARVREYRLPEAWPTQTDIYDFYLDQLNA